MAVLSSRSLFTTGKVRAMPVYEYYCRTCATKFEKLRPMQAADDTADCPAGHGNARRTLSLFATLGRSGAGEREAAGGGGCCGGGGCACGAGALSRN